MSSAKPVYPQDREWPSGSPGTTGAAVADPEHQLPEIASESRPEPSEELNQTAETIGSALGSAVGRVKRFPQELPRRLQELPRRLQEVKRQLKVVVGRASTQARDAVKDMGQTATDEAREAGRRAQRLANEKPLAIIAAAAVVGVVAGIALRIWRDQS